MSLVSKEKIFNSILVFLITGGWDIVLRNMSEGKLKFFGVENMKWIRVLKDYFNLFTVIDAAAVAGIVGFVTYLILSPLFEYLNIQNIIGQILLVFLISGLVGIPMRYSGLFPDLNKYYYEPLGFTYSFITDAMSGVIVAITLFTVNYYIYS
jgi:hypothetical protein